MLSVFVLHLFIRVFIGSIRNYQCHSSITRTRENHQGIQEDVMWVWIKKFWLEGSNGMSKSINFGANSDIKLPMPYRRLKPTNSRTNFGLKFPVRLPVNRNQQIWGTNSDWNLPIKLPVDWTTNSKTNSVLKLPMGSSSELKWKILIWSSQ